MTEEVNPSGFTELDKALDTIFSLSVGALALSITFRADVAGDSPRALWLLGLSWVAFVVCAMGYVFLRLSLAGVLLALEAQSLAHNRVFEEGQHRDAITDQRIAQAEKRRDREEASQLKSDRLKDMEARGKEMARISAQRPAEKVSRWAVRLANATFIGFLCGIVSFAAFALVNLK